MCYDSRESETRQWSFYNAQVVCRELGFPGTMIARKGGVETGDRESIVDGFKCKEGTCSKHCANVYLLIVSLFFT